MNRSTDLDPSAPLYKEVKRLVTQELASGEWRPGDALPSETELAKRYGVSIGTVRRAIDELVAESVVIRHQGRGTFVASHSRRRLLFYFFHIVPRGREKEYPNTRTLAFIRGDASKEEAQKLRITEGDPVHRIRNLLYLSDAPVIVDDIVLSHAQFPDLNKKIFTERENTIYHMYENRYGLSVLRTTERLRATLADTKVAKLLGVRKGVPLLEISRVALSYHNVPVELRHSLVSTEHHEYFSDLARK